MCVCAQVPVSLSRLCNSIVGMKSSGDVSYIQLLLLLGLTTPLLVFNCLLNMPISERQALESPSIVRVWHPLSLKFLYVCASHAQTYASWLLR